MKKNLTYEDQQLIEGCLNSKGNCHRLLYEKYVNAMYHIVIRMVSNKADAEDVIQETFVKVFQNMKSFKGDSTLGAWIKRIAINSALNFLRKKKELHFSPMDEKWNKIPAESPVKVVNMSMKKIHEAIKTLPKGCGAVLNLFLLEGYQHKEIAQILDISESTSKTQYRRAKMMLREVLEGNTGLLS